MIRNHFELWRLEITLEEFGWDPPEYIRALAVRWEREDVSIAYFRDICKIHVFDMLKEMTLVCHTTGEVIVYYAAILEVRKQNDT